MLLYNTLTHRREELVPHEAGKIKMYTCGPTVYHFAHIGHYPQQQLLRLQPRP